MYKICFTIVFLLIVISGFAQISVASFERIDNDLTARVDHPVRDQNGDVCALIKIETSQTGFTFEAPGLGIMKTERKTGEYWVYIPWGSKRLTIKHDQLGILRDYLYPISIDRSTVYLMKLTTGNVVVVVEEPQELTEWVIIESTPSGAQVYIDNSPVGQTPYQREYRYGQYNYRVELPMYHNEAGVINLNSSTGRQTVKANLKPNFGKIFVETSPENGADILLNNRPTGQKTPATLIEVPSGSHRITTKLNMYHDAWSEVTVEDSKTTSLRLDMNPAFGTISVTTDPLSDIYIDNVKVGSGNTNQRKTKGFYTIEARKEKHESHSRRVEVLDNALMDVHLSPKPKLGSLRVITTPHDAAIYINGEKYQTNSPVTIRDLLIGEYQIELRKESYANITETVEIFQNQTAELNLELPDGLSVTINSYPTDVRLEINGRYVGKTPYKAIMDFGTYEIKLFNKTRLVEEELIIMHGGESEFIYFVAENKDFVYDIKSNVRIQDWRKAKLEIQSYLSFKPDTASEEYKEVLQIDKTVSSKIKEEDNLYSQIVADKDINKGRQYLNLFTFGKYRKDVMQIIENAVEEEAWEKAKNAKTTNAYFEYLNKYPSGIYAVEAKNTISRWDKAAYDKAIQGGTQGDLNHYLQNYPKGEYRFHVEKKLIERREYDLYMIAVNSNIITDFENYIKQYRAGKYSSEVNGVIQRSYKKFGDDAMGKKDFKQASMYYEKLIKQYPNYENLTEVNKNLAKSNRKINQKGGVFLLYVLDTNSPLGLGVFGGAKNKMDLYMTYRMKFASFVSWDAIYTIDGYGNTNMTSGYAITTGKTKKSNFAFSIGFTYPLFYPFWMYVGGGGGFYGLYEEADLYSSWSDEPYRTDWLKNTDYSRWTLFPEAGVFFKVYRFRIMYGMMYNRSIVHQFGLAYGFY